MFDCRWLGHITCGRLRKKVIDTLLKPFSPTANVPKRTARGIALPRITHGCRPNPLKPLTSCPGDMAAISGRHIPLNCTTQTPADARNQLLEKQAGPTTWGSITNNNIQLKGHVRFRATIELLQVQHRVMTNKDARDAVYNMGRHIAL